MIRKTRQLVQSQLVDLGKKRLHFKSNRCETGRNFEGPKINRCHLKITIYLATSIEYLGDFSQLQAISTGSYLAN